VLDVIPNSSIKGSKEDPEILKLCVEVKTSKDSVFLIAKDSKRFKRILKTFNALKSTASSAS
jgi:hypothetical protein